MLLLPWSPSTGPFSSPSMPPGVVLPDPALGVYSETDVNTASELRIDAVQHVHAKEAFYLHYHYAKLIYTQFQL